MCRSSRLRRFHSLPPVFAYEVVLAALAPGLSQLRVTSLVTSTRNRAKVQPSLWFAEPVGQSTPRACWMSRRQPAIWASAPGPSATWSSAGRCRESLCPAFVDCCSIAANSIISSRRAASPHSSSLRHRQRKSSFQFEGDPPPKIFAPRRAASVRLVCPRKRQHNRAFWPYRRYARFRQPNDSS